MVNTIVNLGNGLELKNPVLTASGTFGYGLEYDDFFDVSELGGFIVKGTTLQAREGNPYPRLAETPMGMLNAVGLQNKGVEYFCEHIYPQLLKYSNNVIVNVSGASIDDYVKTAERVATLDKIAAIELNISCPNVKQGGMAFGADCTLAGKVVEAVRGVSEASDGEVDAKCDGYSIDSQGCGECRSGLGVADKHHVGYGDRR